VRYTRILRTLVEYGQRLYRLEQHMSRVDDVIADLNTATDEIATELEQLRGDVANVDTVTADKLTPLVERLRGLGADPENPVPDGGSTPAGV
jgi:uncharacterized coiled-coil protein SlyX